MSNTRRPTRAAFQASKSCYDKFCLGVITQERDLCCNCFDYKQILVKKKAQHEMGRRFQCRWPEAGVAVPVLELQSSRPSQTVAVGNNEEAESTGNNTTRGKRGWSQYKDTSERLEKNCT